ncbi:MAG: 3-oxoacyl-[acyl-carrier-protein] reductase [Candidatus Melainabacteria bacterium]|nr:3-oxoacyl-[acyl-carrier-protein] reductase [Candidatus Melainabacteria bacterium]
MQDFKFTGSLKNKVAIVTGGTRGIGKAIAELFVSEGAKVVITGRSAESTAAVEINSSIQKVAQSAAAEINLGEAFYKSCEMSNKEQVKSLIETVVAEHQRLDVLVNNAGITKDNLFIRMKEEEWNDVIDTNLNSLFYICQSAIKVMSKQKSGAVINMTSVVGLHGNPAQCNYSASKGGMIAFTKALAKEYGRRGIRANCIAPGFIKTDMTAELPEDVQAKYKENIPLGDMGMARDIAETALFLAASANYITGQVIQVDGGLFM